MKPRAAFQQRASQAIADPLLQIALDNNATQRRDIWQPAFDSLPNSTDTRSRARAIRKDVVRHLDQYLEQFIRQVSANGIQVHIADNADEARRVILDVASANNVDLVAKSKSMLTEEIELNKALEAAGIRTVETDLGEFIVQLRGEKPTHIITPAVHLRREDVGRTFERHLGVPYTTNVDTMNAVARSNLREIFLKAGVGISGVNFGVVESGTLCMVENEGNIRMVSTIPPVHIAVMGLERLVPTLADLAVMLQVLPRAATGQKLTSYISWINSPRQPGEPDGPRERHLVLVDNNRIAMSDSLMSEALLCIRCGACLNACPVYQEVGGAAYDSVYPGPIGSLVSPGLFGVKDFGHLAKASTFCGACVEACPVGIDFPTLLQRTRVDYVKQVRQPSWLVVGLRVFSWMAASPRRFRFAQRLSAWITRLLPRRAGWLRWLPPPFNAWTRSRYFPAISAKPFRQRWAQLSASSAISDPKSIANIAQRLERRADENLTTSLVDIFASEVVGLGAEFIQCSHTDLRENISKVLSKINTKQLLLAPLEMIEFKSLLDGLESDGLELMDADHPLGQSLGAEALAKLSSVKVGLTRSIAALADTGTLIQPSGAGRSQLASLLPPVHIAILFEQDIFSSMGAWLDAGGSQLVRTSSNLVMISGPSRTADIEMTLTLGVHGPGRLIIFCVD